LSYFFVLQLWYLQLHMLQLLLLHLLLQDKTSVIRFQQIIYLTTGIQSVMFQQRRYLTSGWGYLI
jgi:hypothetical protein